MGKYSTVILMTLSLEWQRNGAIANRLGIRKRAVSRACKKFENQGIVESRKRFFTSSKSRYEWEWRFVR